LTGSKEEERKSLLERSAVLITSAYFLAIVAAWGYAHYHGTKLGEGIEAEKLNILGDLLAGLFAPVAFIWLVVAVMIQSKELAAQREELALTREEMQESRAVMQKQADAADQQTRLAIVSTKANYQLALYEKRLAVYTQLDDIAFELSSAGTVSADLQRKIRSSTEAARFVFADDVAGWLRDVSQQSFNAMRFQSRIERLNEKRAQSGLNEQETEKHGELVDHVTAIEMLLYDELASEKIDNLLTPYLKLPATIEIHDNPAQN
jgi:hypothetical protein